MNGVVIFFTGLLLMIVIMLITWWFSERIGKAAIVDVVWTFNIGLLALFYLLTIPRIDSFRTILVSGMGILWSLRLGIYLLKRVGKEKEDKRYAVLKKDWGKQGSRKMLIFFQQQGVVNSVLSLPILLAVLHTAPFPSLFDFFGTFLTLVAITGEGISDWQLKKFKAASSNRGKTCRSGLWRYTRHPNYFFEWLFWMSLPLFSIGSSWGWMAWLSPIIMFTILIKVTGIPPAERQALISRGEDYRRYQRETNAFFPWFPNNIS